MIPARNSPEGYPVFDADGTRAKQYDPSKRSKNQYVVYSTVGGGASVDRLLSPDELKGVDVGALPEQYLIGVGATQDQIIKALRKMVAESKPSPFADKDY
jgi:hypothetical protein